MERFAVVVERLHSDLTAAASDSVTEGEKGIAVAPDDYDLIAKIERSQIIRERYQSIQRSHEGEEPGYAVQIGFAAQEAKSRLPTPARLLIDERILQLVKDPQPPGTVTDPQGSLRHLPVPKASAEIVFEVDQQSRRVRIVGIASPAAGALDDPHAGD